MLEMVVLDVDETLGPNNPQHTRMKISLGTMIPWSSKFFKLVRDARGNHVVVL
jgi:hypothetical protein